MKILLAQPAITRFKWELDVCLTNIRSLDKEVSIVLLFLEGDFSVPLYFEDKYENVEVHTYTDKRENREYPATTRPYLMWRYLSEDKSREQEDYFQIDSDIIFRELPDFSKMKGKVCYGSDCGSYIDYRYLSKCSKGDYIIENFSKIVNIPVETIQSVPGIGAQYYIPKPTAQLWYHIWQDSQLLYDFLKNVDSNIQKWTAEMWAQLYNLVKFGWEVKISKDIDFCRPTDDIREYDKVKILHNAGVMSSETMFFKGKYDRYEPFGEDFSWVDKNKASYRYVEAIKKVVQ